MIGREGIWIRSRIAWYIAIVSGAVAVTGIAAIILILRAPGSLQLIYIVWGVFLSGLLILLALLTRLTAAAKDAREASYDFNSELYGYAYESLQVIGTVETGGSINLRRDMFARAYSTEIDRVDQWILVPDAPAHSDLELGNPQILEPAFVEIRKRTVHQTSDRATAVLEIDPAIKIGEDFQYRMSETLPAGSMALTHAELKSKDESYEFVAWDINRPTRHFNLSVTFPAKLAPPKIVHDVWFGFSRMINPRERERIETGWSEVETGTERQYSLDVPYPVLGLTYVIKWIPPDSIETEV